MQPGTQVRRRKDGRLGTIVSNDGSEIIVKYDATGETMNSPWGEYADAGQEGHVFSAFANRLLEVV